jgi:NADH:ubiquinone oxidoreductase subunit 6 (subunit J)
MDKTKFAFGKVNYILLIIGAIAIIAGFILMTGPSSTDTMFEPNIFSFRRIKLAPAICFLGFVSMIVSIMVKPKDKKRIDNE